MDWEKSPDTHNDLVSGAMQRNRFEQIFSYIHFCDNSKLDEHDKFSKIRPLIKNRVKPILNRVHNRACYKYQIRRSRV